MYVVVTDRGWLPLAVYGPYGDFAQAAGEASAAVASKFARAAHPVALHPPALLTEDIAEAKQQAPVKEE